MEQVKEIPILFNGEMVQAILDGRKTQTRRPVKQIIDKRTTEIKWNSAYEAFVPWSNLVSHSGAGFFRTGEPMQSPFGKPGDILWVRETFRKTNCKHWMVVQEGDCFAYRAGGDYFCGSNDPHLCDDAVTWTPSIHMPKSACRIKLKVNRVWVERVQDIDSLDATKEGIVWDPGVRWTHYDEKRSNAYVSLFSDLWDSIYGTWDDNVWVWCCEFEVI